MQGRQLELGVPRTMEEDLRRVPRSGAEGEEGSEEATGGEIRRRNPMMSHLPEALARGENIGHDEQIEEFWEEKAAGEEADDRRR